jgi:hypothetical protein
MPALDANAIPAPTVVEAAYDDVALTVTVGWDPLPGYVNFVVTLRKNGTDFAGGTGFGGQGTITLGAALTPDTYEVSAAATEPTSADEDAQQGPYGNWLTVIVDRLASLSAATEPRRVSARWGLPGGGTLVNGAELTVEGPGGVIGRNSLLGTEGAVDLHRPLDPSVAFSLLARPTFGGSIGPYLELPLVSIEAQIAEMRYEPDGKQIEVLLLPPVPSECQAGAALFGDGELVKSQQAAGALVALPIDGDLDPAVSWEVRPFWQAGEARGPYGRAAEVMVTSPAIRGVGWEDGELSVSWAQYPAPPYATGAEVTVAPAAGSGEALRRKTFTGVSEGAFSPDPPLTPGTAYVATVTAVRGPSYGSPGPPLPVLADRPPAPASVHYDGAVLTARWQATPPPGATGCTLLVLQGDAVLLRVPAQLDAPGASVDVPLDPEVTGQGGSYLAALQWTAGGSAGPVGPTAPVIVDVPGVEEIAVGDAKVEVAVAQPTGRTGIDAYTAWLLCEGRRLKSASAPASPDGSPVATIPFEAEGRAGFEVRVGATGPTGRGPECAPVPVPSAPPRVERAVVDGSQLALEWAPPAAQEVVSTAVVVTPSSGEPVTFPGLHGGSTTLDLPASLLDPGLILTLQASCTTEVGTTPSSERLTLLTSTPALGRVTFDGARAVAEWSWSGDATGAQVATAYRLSLQVGGVEVKSAIVPASPGGLVLDAPLDPAVAAEVRVSPLAGAAEAAAVSGTALVVSPPGLQSASVKAGEVTLGFDGVPSADRCLAVFSSPGYADVAVELPDPSPSAVPVPSIATDPLVPLEVALVAESGSARGPRSESLPVLRAAVEPTLAAADDGVLTVEWDAVAGGATAYAATLYCVGVAEATATVAGYQARLDASGVKAGSAYTVGVVARAGAAAGPPAPRLPVVLAPAVLSKPSFDGRTLAATLTPPAAAGATLTGCELGLLRNGEAVQRARQEPLLAAGVTLAVDTPVDPRAVYELEARPRAGAALGPPVRARVLLVPPVVDSLTCADGTLTVSASAGDLPVEGLTLYATLYVSGRQPQVEPLTDGSASFAAPAGGECEVAVHGEIGDATSPPSPRLTALTTAPKVTSARLSGARLAARWSEVPGKAYALAVTGAGGLPVAEATVAGPSAELEIEPEEGATYTLTVSPVDGRVSGPPASLPLLTASCETRAATQADGRTVMIEWSAPTGGSTPTGFAPVACWEGSETELPSQPAGTTSATLTLPAEVPAGAAIGVRAVAGAATGPLANLAPVIAAAPENLRLRYVGGTLHATWSPPADARVTGATVTLTESGNEITEQVAGASWSAAVAADSGATVAVAATAGAGTGPVAGPLVAILAAPKIETWRFDGSLLRIEWEAAAPKGVSAWRVAVSHWDRLVAEATVTRPSAVLPLPTRILPFEQNGDVTVTVTALGEGVEGPASAPSAAPVAGPRVIKAASDPLTGVTTVSWMAVTTPTSPTYSLAYYVDGAFAGKLETTETSAPLPPLEPEADFAVSVAALAPPGSFEGPYGPRFRVPTAVPAVEAVRFDGRTATVRWRGVANATGYGIDVVGGELKAPAGHADADATAREAQVTVTIPDESLEYEVAVTARFGADSGPPAPAPLFSPGLYVDPAQPARVLRTKAMTLDVEPVLAYLPPMGTLDPTALPIAPVQQGTSPGTSPFVLAANEDAKTKEAFPYTLTIDHGALAFDANRPNLHEAYVSLLSAADAAGAKPWGIFAIQAAIARLMPQTFEETLLYAYGLDPSAGCVDLRPGMVLRVAFSEFDPMPADNPPPSARGYVGGAVVDYDIEDYFAGQEWLVGFDAFVAWLAGNSVMEVPAPVAGSVPPGPDFVESGAAEGADLFFPGFRTPFHRLFFPATLAAANSPAPSRTKKQFTLAAAATYVDLQQSGPSPLPTKTSVAYFRGRTIVKPSLRIVVDGGEQVVPLGTTVGNVLDRLGRRPPSAAMPLSGISLERSLGPVVLDPARGYDAAAAERVALDWQGLATFGAPRDALSLPLLHGDRLSVSG